MERDDDALIKLILMYREVRSHTALIDVEVIGEDAPYGVRDFCGTERVDNDTQVFDNRLTRCNELTNYAMLWGDAPAGARLIHGSIHGRYEGNERIQHSWLIIRTSRGEMVWEPITHLWYDKEAWYDYARAWEEREYTAASVKALTKSSGHYGPWHESSYP